MTKLKVLSLFSGIGMFDYGLEQTGKFETVMFCEQDQYCRTVLEKHWPQVHISQDIRTLELKDIFSKIDVVTASWPCQGHSVAGKKRGLEDERSGLWKEVKRILRESEAEWFIGENSANLRTNGLTEVLQDLWEIGFRDIRWDVLPAEAYGAIHKRERIYIIANRNGIRLSNSTFTSTEKEQKRRSEAWSSFSNRLCPEPTFYRVDDGHALRVDKSREKDRKQRVKQCGNSLYWPIVERLGNYIVEQIELNKKLQAA